VVRKKQHGLSTLLLLVEVVVLVLAQEAHKVKVEAVRVAY
jgi:hypothetical protein